VSQLKKCNILNELNEFAKIGDSKTILAQMPQQLVNYTKGIFHNISTPRHNGIHDTRQLITEKQRILRITYIYNIKKNIYSSHDRMNSSILHQVTVSLENLPAQK